MPTARMIVIGGPRLVRYRATPVDLVVQRPRSFSGSNGSTVLTTVRRGMGVEGEGAVHGLQFRRSVQSL